MEGPRNRKRRGFRRSLFAVGLVWTSARFSEENHVAEGAPDVPSPPPRLRFASRNTLARDLWDIDEAHLFGSSKKASKAGEDSNERDNNSTSPVRVPVAPGKFSKSKSKKGHYNSSTFEPTSTPTSSSTFIPTPLSKGGKAGAKGYAQKKGPKGNPKNVMSKVPSKSKKVIPPPKTPKETKGKEKGLPLPPPPGKTPPPKEPPPKQLPPPPPKGPTQVPVSVPTPPPTMADSFGLDSQSPGDIDTRSPSDGERGRSLCNSIHSLFFADSHVSPSI